MNFHLSGPEEKVTRAVRVLFLETFQRRHFFLETSDQKAERERERESERGEEEQPFFGTDQMPTASQSTETWGHHQ
jgi:hypothetical protein